MELKQVIKNTIKKFNDITSKIAEQHKFSATTIEKIDNIFLFLDTYTKESPKLEQSLQSLTKEYNSHKSVIFLVQIFYSIIADHITPKDKTWYAKQCENIKMIQKNIQHEYSTVITQLITQQDENLINMFKEFTSLCEKNDNSWDLYTEVSNNVLDLQAEQPKVAQEIFPIVEKAKSSILAKDTKTSKNIIQSNNYGLLPISKTMPIDEIGKLLFGKSVKNIEELTKIANKSEYDVFLITKYWGRGIEYDIIDLLNPLEAKRFEGQNQSIDGITKQTIERYNNIRYISNKTLPEKTTKKMLSNNKNFKYALILEEISKGYYHILTNTFSPSIPQDFTKKASIPEFIEYMEDTPKPNRIEAYNDLINKKIMQTMVLQKPIDIENIRIKANILSPKYLRVEIIKKIKEEYKKLYTKELDIYHVNKRIVNKKYEQIFSQVLTTSYYEYVNSQKKIYDFETLASFMYTLSIYKRDFKKKLNDLFGININNIKSSLNNRSKIDFIFEKIINDTVDSVITSETNIYQALHFKSNLYQTQINSQLQSA